MLGLAAQFASITGEGIIAPELAYASGTLPGLKGRTKTANGWIPEPVLLGTMLGEEVLSTSDKILSFSQVGPINSLIKTVELPEKTDQTATVPMTLTVARVGNVALVGLGGEVFHEIGQAIKQASPFPHTFVIAHCNGGAGYLVVKEAYAEGGYEVRTSHLAPRRDLVLEEVALHDSSNQ